MRIEVSNASGKFKVKKCKKKPKAGTDVIIKTVSGYFKATVLDNGAEYISNSHHYVGKDKILAYYTY